MMDDYNPNITMVYNNKSIDLLDPDKKMMALAIAMAPWVGSAMTMIAMTMMTTRTTTTMATMTTAGNTAGAAAGEQGGCSGAHGGGPIHAQIKEQQ
jgi:hypothetical protein